MIYGNHLPDATQMLSDVFKKAHSLQMTFLSIFDSLVVEATQQDVEDMLKSKEIEIRHYYFTLGWEAHI